MAKYTLQLAGNFKSDVKRCMRRHLPMQELWDVVAMLLDGQELPQKYRAHKLTGDHVGEWECHIRPDWLLIWEQHEKELILIMTNTGSHSDIFG